MHLAALHDADAGDDAGARRVAAVEAVRGERRQFEERRPRVEDRVDALARQQLAAGSRAPIGAAGHHCHGRCPFETAGAAGCRRQELFI
jgi:hypothetical protein